MITQYVVVDKAKKMVLAGPFLWDSATQWQAPVDGDVIPVEQAKTYDWSLIAGPVAEPVRDMEARRMAADASKAASTATGAIALAADQLSSLISADQASSTDRADLRSKLTALTNTVSGIQVGPSNAQLASAVSAYMAANPSSPGQDGKSIEVKNTGTEVQWRQAGGTWSTLYTLSSVTPSAGADGKSVEVRNTGTEIQWRQTGGAWATLYTLASVTPAAPADGKSVEVRNTGTEIQWRQTGGTWATLYTLASVTGAAGVNAAANQRVGVGVVPALLLGASVDVSVTWDSPMPNATYNWSVASGALIGKGIATFKAKDAASITFTVKSTAAVISANTLFVVVAWTP